MPGRIPRLPSRVPPRRLGIDYRDKFEWISDTVGDWRGWHRPVTSSLQWLGYPRFYRKLWKQPPMSVSLLDFVVRVYKI